MKKCLIFDFDGVLVDSKDLIFETLNYSVNKLNLPLISDEEFHKSSKHQLLKERNISKFKILILLIIARRYINRNSHKIKVNTEFLKLIRECPNDAFIVSSNSKKVIKKVLKDDFFHFKKCIGSAGLNGKHKILLSLPSNSIYITDEVRDVIECQHIKMPVLGVTWGIDNEQSLKASNCDGILTQFSDLLFYLN